MSSFRISEERCKILGLLDSNPDAQGCKVLKWTDWRARRIVSSQIFPRLNIDLKAPQYIREQQIREIDDEEKTINVKLLFSGYDVPGYSRCILTVTEWQPEDGVKEVEDVQLRKFGSISFPARILNLCRV